MTQSLIFLALIASCNAIELDIHLPLHYGTDWMSKANFHNLCPYNMALESNLALIDHALPDKSNPESTRPAEQIDFFDKHVPHVTLYLADFAIENRSPNGNILPGTTNHTLLQPLLSSIQTSLASTPNITQCTVTLDLDVTPTPNDHPIVNGYYAKWNVLHTPCLQRLSDTIVDAAHSYARTGDQATVPEWVYNLPEATKRKKIQYVKEYGSPNVRDEFRPHVTVGYDTVTPPLDRTRTLVSLVDADENKPWKCEGFIEKVGVGLVGEFGGTVLVDGTLVLIDLKRGDMGGGDGGLVERD